MVECPDLCCYSSVVFYDQDGTAAANVLSVLHRAFKALKRRQVCRRGGIAKYIGKLLHLGILCYNKTSSEMSMLFINVLNSTLQIEDVFIILGGFSSIESRFPHLILRPPPPPPAPPSPQHLQSSTPNQLSVLGSPSPPIPPSPPPPPLRGLIPWMPTLVGSDRLFLGRHEQAEADAVVFGLGITHVLSIGRCWTNVFVKIKCFELVGIQQESRDPLRGRDLPGTGRGEEPAGHAGGVGKHR